MRKLKSDQQVNNCSDRPAEITITEVVRHRGMVTGHKRAGQKRADNNAQINAL